MSFAPVKKLKVAEQVAASIRDAILGGAYEPGDTLPSERNLAEQFEVNRSSVREALHRLEAWGLVEVRQGGATKVREFLMTTGLHLLPYLLAPGGEMDAKMVFDLLEMRAMMLRWTGYHAALRSTPETVDALGETLEALEAATEAREVQRLDFEFYEQMVSMTGNRVLAMVSSAVRRVYLENGDLFRDLFDPVRFDTARHREAWEAVRTRDPERAAAAMEAHARAGFGMGGFS